MAILKVANIHFDVTGSTRLQANGANVLTFVTGNTEDARFDASGNLLIGRVNSTVGQGVKLDVAGAINASAVLINGTPAFSNTTATLNGSLTTTGTITSSGSITANASLIVTAFNGTSEGGEISLRGARGTAFYDDWNIDSFQNSLRLFTGGSNTNQVQIINIGAGAAQLYVESNVTIGRTDSTVGQGVILDVAGAINASAVLVNGVSILTIANSYGTAVGAAGNAYTNAVGTAGNTIAIAAFAKANSTTYTSNIVISVADNTNAALRITQTGTGEAIRVEDSANPDATPFVVTASGEVGVGTATPFTSTTTFISTRDPLIASDGSYIGGGAYWDGGNWRSTVASQGGWVIRNTSGQFALWTGYNSGAANTVPPVFTERLRVDGNGNVLISRTDSTVGQGVKLDVNGAINASAVLVNGVSILTIANSYGTAVGAAGNAYTNAISTSIGTAGNNYTNAISVSIGTAGNNYTNAVGAASNTIAIAAFAKANSTSYTSNLVISVADNTNAALRITQTGTGEAIRVEDEANPDSTPFVVTATGNVLVGRTADSTVGLGVKLDVAGAINTAALYVNGATVTGGGAAVFSANVGNNSANLFSISHNLNKNFVVPAVRENSTGYYVYPDMKHTSANTIVLEFVTAPTTNQYTVIVLG
jgi:hypothetical protein